MKRLFSIFSILCFIQAHLLGQVTMEELKKDPDVVWISMQEVAFKLPFEDNGNTNIIRHISNSDSINWLPTILWKGIMKEEIKVYANADLTIPVLNKSKPWQEIKVPEGNGGDSTTLESVMNNPDIVNATLKSVIYYKKSNAEFGIIPLAIGFRNIAGADGIPVLWVPVEQATFGPRIGELNLTFIWTNKKVHFAFEEAKNAESVLLKMTCNEEIGKNFLGFCRDNYRLLKFENWDNIPIDSDTFKYFFHTTDTVITLDPEVFVETVRVNHKEWNFADVDMIRLRLTAWWDDKRNKIFIYQEPIVAPYFLEKDMQGNFLFRYPLFYRRY